MNFLSPWLLAGLAGLLVPVAAHLLRRKPPETVQFATLRFVVPGSSTVTRPRRLEDHALLLLRLLLLALAVVILARPATTKDSSVSVMTEPHDAVFVVDGSGSMALRTDGSMVIDRAITRCEQVLESLAPNTRVGLVTSDPRGPVLAPSLDHDAVRSALARWRHEGAPHWGSWTMTDAVDRAKQLLTETPAQRKRVLYAFADGTAGGLASLPDSDDQGWFTVPVPVLDADEVVPEHVGLVEVTSEPAPELGPAALRIDARVRRYPASDGSSTAEPFSVSATLQLDNGQSSRGSVAVRPGHEATIEFTHTLDKGEERNSATVTLDIPHDPLPIDDRRHMWLAADHGIDVLVVNGDPSELRAHDEVYFVTTALNTGDPHHRIRISTLAPDQLDLRLREQGPEALASIDVLILANVRMPSPDVIPSILTRIGAGMGLWITVGDRVDVHAYNAGFSEALPLKLRDAVVLGTAPGRDTAVLESLAPADVSHPLFRGVSADIGLSSTRVRKAMLCEPAPDRAAEVAMTYTNGAPALVTAQYGIGRVALLTTSIDRDWSDLPLRPGFVPLALTVVDYLSKATNDRRGGTTVVGEPRALGHLGTTTITLPSGDQVTQGENDTLFTDTFEAGHYLARSETSVMPFIVQVDPMESDLTGRPWVKTNAAAHTGWATTSSPIWRPLVPLLALLLAAESLLRLRRRR